MSIFDFRCPTCKAELLDVFLLSGEEGPKCCSQPMEKFFTSGTKHFPFKEGWYEHLDTQPIYIQSKRQLREECEKRGLTSEYARD